MVVGLKLLLEWIRFSKERSWNFDKFAVSTASNDDKTEFRRRDIKI